MKSAIQSSYFLAAENCQIDEVTPSTKGNAKKTIGADVRQWNVSYRKGNEFPGKNSFDKSSLNKEINLETDAALSRNARPRPHLRRAHWYHYWAGPGKSQLVLRWIAPVLVNALDENSLIATEHKTS